MSTEPQYDELFKNQTAKDVFTAAVEHIPDGGNQGDIAEAVNVSQPTVGNYLNPMIEAGLVKKQGRGRYVITETATEIYEAVTDAGWAPVLEEDYDSLTTPVEPSLEQQRTAMHDELSEDGLIPEDVSDQDSHELREETDRMHGYEPDGKPDIEPDEPEQITAETGSEEWYEQTAALLGDAASTTEEQNQDPQRFPDDGEAEEGLAEERKKMEETGKKLQQDRAGYEGWDSSGN